MHIRPAHEGDLAAIQLLYAEPMPVFIPNPLIALNDQHMRVAQSASDDGSVIGVSVLTQSAFVWVSVAPEHRRQGIGTLLLRDALRQASNLGLAELNGQIDEGNAAATVLSERFQFKPYLYAVTLSLDLTHWDETVLAPMLNQALASGIQFVTFAELGDTPEHRRQLYDLNKALNATIPRDQPQVFAPFETYVERRLLNRRMPHEGIWIALDSGQWIGMTQISLEDGSAFNQMTGVLPDYRGRGIAQALKLLLIRFAQQNDRPIIQTFNDVTNLPMIAVNEKAGFRQQGRFRWARRKPIEPLEIGAE